MRPGVGLTEEGEPIEQTEQAREPERDSGIWPGRLAAAGIFLGICFSQPLWTGIGKTFPAADILPCPLSPAIDQLLVALLLSSCLAIFFDLRRRAAIIILFVSSVLLTLLDLNRFQPWLYEDLLIILFCLLQEKVEADDNSHTDPKLQPIALLLVAIYLFSGLQKLNWRFLTVIGPWLTGFSHDLTASVLDNPAAFWTAASMAIIEIFLAILLCFGQTRLPAIILGTIMHITVMCVLGPQHLNTNTAVWPWNVVQIFLLIYCFWNVGEGNLFRLDLKQRPLTWLLALCTCLVIPILGVLQIADPYPSFALYAGDVPAAKLMFEKSTAFAMSAAVQKDCCFLDESTGLYYVDLNDWLHLETGASAYPSDFAFRLEGRRFAQDHPGQLVVLKTYHYPKLSKQARDHFETLGRANPSRQP